MTSLHESPSAAAPDHPYPADDQSKLLGALTLATMQRLGDAGLLVDEDNNVREFKMVRIGSICALRVSGR